MSELSKLETMAESYGLTFKELANGHVQLSNHGVLVNYWPLSKNRTCHIQGKHPVKHCSHYDAVKLCMQSGKVGLKPKKEAITKNGTGFSLNPVHSNLAGIKHLYEGEKPPWEYPTKIMCYPDMLRLQANELLEQAKQQEEPLFYQDCV